MDENRAIRADSLRQILSANPHSWWSDFRLWRRWRRTQILYQDFSRTRIGLNDFEREILFPEILSRLDYFELLLRKVQATCKEPAVRSHIGPALVAMEVAPPGANFVVDYLDRLIKIIDESFIEQIVRVRTESRHVVDLKSLVRFLNSVRFICSSVVGNRTTLFWYSTFKHQVVVNRKTGELLTSDEPIEFGIILMPFKIILENLVTSATATEATIEHWKKQLEESKKPFLEYLASTAMLSANRITVWIQILTILVAIVWSLFFLTAGDPFSLKRSNTALEERLQAQGQKDANERSGLMHQVSDLQVRLTGATSRADAELSETLRLRGENASLKQQVADKEKR